MHPRKRNIVHNIGGDQKAFEILQRNSLNFSVASEHLGNTSVALVCLVLLFFVKKFVRHESLASKLLASVV